MTCDSQMLLGMQALSALFDSNNDNNNYYYYSIRVVLSVYIVSANLCVCVTVCSLLTG